jgi:hypothetical protein
LRSVRPAAGRVGGAGIRTKDDIMNDGVPRAAAAALLILDVLMIRQVRRK